MPSQKGFTLIELLVALIIVAIGVLGMLAMQLRGAQATHESLYRTQALLYAEGLQQRMMSAADHGKAIFDTRAANNSVFKEWQTKLQANIPGAETQFTKGAAVGRNQPYTLTVSWPDGISTTGTKATMESVTIEMLL